MDVVYRAAIIGTGRIGSTYDDEVVDPKDASFYRGDKRHSGLYTVLPVNHAKSYLTTPGFKLVAASNRGEAKLRTFGERWGVRALYTDFRKMLAEERPDVVSVCTQSADKAEVTIAAAEAGVKTIIVEKALATSMAEADAMLAACERNGVFLAVNHPNRFSPMNREVKALIDGGAIGTPGVIAAYAGGGMLHIGTHTFDVMRYLGGGDVVEVDARVPNYVPEKDIAASGTIWFDNGVMGFFDHVHSTHSGYEARGTGGYVSVSSMVGDGWLHRIAPFHVEGVKSRFPNQLSVEPIEGGPHTQSPTQRMLSEVYQSLTTGVPFISTGRDGYAALEIGLACYASHLADGPVKLPLSDRTLRVPNR